MEYIALKVTSEQQAAVEQMLAGEMIDSRLVDMSELFQKVCREQPDLFFEAAQKAAKFAKELINRLDDIYQLLVTGDHRGYEAFIEPIVWLMNATTNGIDKNISKDYLSFVGDINHRLSDILMQGAVRPPDKRDNLIKEYHELIDRWTAAHVMELITKYDQTSQAQTNIQ